MEEPETARGRGGTGSRPVQKLDCFKYTIVGTNRNYSDQAYLIGYTYTRGSPPKAFFEHVDTGAKFYAKTSPNATRFRTERKKSSGRKNM